MDEVVRKQPERAGGGVRPHVSELRRQRAAQQVVRHDEVVEREVADLGRQGAQEGVVLQLEPRDVLQERAVRWRVRVTPYHEPRVGKPTIQFVFVAQSNLPPEEW